MNYWDYHGWGLGQGSFYMHEMAIPISIGIIQCCTQEFYWDRTLGSVECENRLYAAAGWCNDCNSS